MYMHDLSRNTNAGLVSFDKFLESSGLSNVTGWRYSLVAAVNGAVALVCDDEIVVAGRKPLVDRHHARVGGEMNLRVVVDDPGFNP